MHGAPSILIQRTATLLWAALVSVAMAWPAGAQGVRAIADADALQAALSQGASGAVLELAPGNYGRLELRPGQAPAVIRSREADNPAIFTWARVTGFDGLVMEDLVLSYSYNPGQDLSIRPFLFRDGHGLVLRNIDIQGDVARDLDEVANGLGYGVGLVLRGISGVTLTDSRIAQFYRGMVVSGCTDVHITRNELTDMRMDGMNFVLVDRVWIEDNLVHGFNRSTDPSDHADMIQFWTNRTDRPSRNIFIRRNILNSGDGDRTQTIFMRNDMVDRGLAGEEMFYRNIVIEDNVILNGHLHGITVGETIGLTIRNNTLVQNPRAIGSDSANRVFIPRITLANTSRRVTVTGNITGGLVGERTRWQMADNVVVQNFSRLHPNHYSVVFDTFLQGDPTQIDSYSPNPAGVASGLGAPRLRP